MKDDLYAATAAAALVTLRLTAGSKTVVEQERIEEEIETIETGIISRFGTQRGKYLLRKIKRAQEECE